MRTQFACGCGAWSCRRSIRHAAIHANIAGRSNCRRRLGSSRCHNHRSRSHCCNSHKRRHRLPRLLPLRHRSPLRDKDTRHDRQPHDRLPRDTQRIGGEQVGVNYQVNNFVIGGEWDFDWAANHNNGSGVVTPGGNVIAVNANNRWITTLAARFGVAVDHWLFYGKAGGGWVGNNGLTVTNLTTGVSFTCGTFSALTTSCGNSTGGWLVGAGFEYAFTNNWTVKLEYDYLGLGNRTFFIPATAPILPNDTFTSGNRNVQMVKVGFNYLFNWYAPRY